jgi:hypothetical protein
VCSKQCAGVQSDLFWLADGLAEMVPVLTSAKSVEVLSIDFRKLTPVL